MPRVSLSSIYVRTPVGSLTPSLHEAQRNQCGLAPTECSTEDSVGEWFSLFEGTIVQFHHFEYEISREFVRGKSWGHEPSEIKT